MAIKHLKRGEPKADCAAGDTKGAAVVGVQVMTQCDSHGCRYGGANVPFGQGAPYRNAAD